MYTYPHLKSCAVCGASFECHSKRQVESKATCGKACKSAHVSRLRTGRAIKRQQPVQMVRLCCGVCGGEFLRKASSAKNYDSHYCGRSCMGKARYAALEPHASRGNSTWSPEALSSFKARMSGAKNPNWRGGACTRHRKGEYGFHKIKYIKVPENLAVMARSDGYAMEHRVLVAQALGRPLTRSEVVHHVNHDPTDNRLVNLMLFATNAEHKDYEAGGPSRPIHIFLS